MAIELDRQGNCEPGFVKDDSRVYWTDGKKYTRDGTAPNRIQVYRIMGHHGYQMTYESAECLDWATEEEATAFCERMIEYFNKAEERERSAHEQKLKKFQSERNVWASRAKP